MRKSDRSFWLGLLATLASSGFVAWLFWGPIRGFFFSLIPQTAEYAWVGKLICLVLVGYFGGIAFPIVVLILGIGLTIELNK